MNPCRPIRKKLSAYQDGEVGATEKDVIESHLHLCEECRMHYEALLQTSHLLKSMPVIEADDGLSLRILGRVNQTQASLWVQLKENLLRLVPAPAAMVALAVVGILVGTIMGDFWIKQQFLPIRTSTAFQSEPALTIVSVKAFDAAPSGSFAASYLQLTAFSQEIRHAK